MTTTDRPRARDDIVFRQIDEDFVVYDPVKDTTTLLNPSAAVILGLCDGTLSLQHIEEELARIFSIEREVATRDVANVIRELRLNGLIELPAPPVGPDSGGVAGFWSPP